MVEMELIVCVVVILVIWNGILTFCIVKRKKKEIEENPGMIVHTCNLSTEEAETGCSLRLAGYTV